MTAQAIPVDTAHRIRRAYMVSACSLDAIARRFSVSRYTVWKVVSGNHKHTRGLPAISRLRGPGSSRVELADVQVTIKDTCCVRLACPCGWTCHHRLGDGATVGSVTDPALRHLVEHHWR